MLEYMDLRFECKTSESGTVEGWGAIFATPDQGRDVIVPGAFAETIKRGGHSRKGFPMLLHHDLHKPIGKWNELAEKRKGLWVRGKIAIETRDGKDAHILARDGILTGLSIGFNPMIEEYDKPKKIRYLKEIDLWEVSLVTFPLHLNAVVERVKNGSTSIEVKEAFSRFQIGSQISFVIGQAEGRLNDLREYGATSEEVEMILWDIREQARAIEPDGLKQFTEHVENQLDEYDMFLQGQKRRFFERAPAEFYQGQLVEGKGFSPRHPMMPFFRSNGRRS